MDTGIERTDFDFELKLARARENLDRVEQETKRFLREVEKSIVELKDPDAPGYLQVWIEAEPVRPYPLAPLIGDGLQCLRTSLDYLAFELATSHTSPLPDDVAQDSQFPILSDRNRKGKSGEGPNLWRDGGRSMVRGIKTAAQEVIESKQPYHAGAAYESEPLWILHELNRIEKHRFLHLAVMSYEGVVFPPRSRWKNVADIDKSSVVTMQKRIEGRTVIARFRAIPRSRLEGPNVMRVGVWPKNLAIVFDDSVPLVAGKPIVPTLWRLYNHVAREVVLPLRPFLKKIVRRTDRHA